MSTSVCQGLQSQFDPWLIEPRGVQFKMAQSTCSFAFASTFSPRTDYCRLAQNMNVLQQDTGKTDLCKELSTKTRAKNKDMGGWSFLQALSNTTQNAQNEKETVYIHPLAKRSAALLSEKSLEMCTESLGSETGSIFSENEDELNSSFSVSETERSSRMPCFGARKRSAYICSFPPPLTTIRGGGGSGGVQVKSLREEGRLVIKAVSVVTHQSCFKAERRDGRLMLHFLHEDAEESVDQDDHVNCNFYDVNDNENDDDDDDDNDDYSDMEGIKRNVGDEVKLGNYRRLSWCKDGGDMRRKEMLNWEQFWVATS